MRMRYRMTVVVGFVAAVAAAAAAFAQTGTPSPTQTPGGGDRPRAERAGKRLVHSESKVQVEGGFALRIVDNGEITRVEGTSVTIRRADGETVTVTAAGDTRVHRNGEEAAVSALRTGDRAHIVQVEQDGTRTVRAIRAHSPDFQPQNRRGRGPKRLHRRPGSVEQAPAPGDAAEPAMFDA